MLQEIQSQNTNGMEIPGKAQQENPSHVQASLSTVNEFLKDLTELKSKFTPTPTGDTPDSNEVYPFHS